jgi:uncharacterized protein (TIGR03083 family)
VSKFDAYAETRASLLELLFALSEEQLAAPVPATPGWSVMDVASHLTGVARSFTTGKFEGSPGPAWTDGHVTTRRGRDVRTVVAEWDGYLGVLEEMINAGEAGAPIRDIWCHEQDIRGALKIPGNRDAVAAVLCMKSVRAVPKLLEDTGLAAPTVIVDGEIMVEGEGPTLTMDAYLAARVMYGRRSATQIAALDWSSPPGAIAEEMTIFGPSETDIFDD